MDEIRALAGPVVQRHFEKVEAERQAVQARLEAEKAAKKAAEEEARRAADAEKGTEEGTNGLKDEEMTDVDAPQKADAEGAPEP
jgi:heat shock protein 4